MQSRIVGQVGAINEKKELTSLGHHLAAMPVDVHIGKVMLYGAIFGCLMPALTIAACLSYRSPFYSFQREKHAAELAWQALVAPSSATKESGEQSIARGEQSDHLAMVAAYEGWRSSLEKGGSKAAREYCRKTFLSIQTLEMIRDMRRQFATLLADIGFVKLPKGSATKDKWAPDWVDDPKQLWNVHALQPSIVKAVLCAGLYPNIAAMTEESILLGHASAINAAGGGSGARPKWTDGERPVAIHPSSINHPLTNFKFPFMVYHEKVQTSRVFIRDCSVVSPYQLLLFGGPITVQHQTGQVTVDGWLSLKAPAQIAVLFKELRRALDALLAQKISRPKQADTDSSVDREVIGTIAKLLIDEQKPQM
ncbi:hypothetical protein CBR_g34282 [Chara braunii]|uniref:Helicase-associated domain-containing protein n=1 Tax=Chara braunii TaxID=69332 RepID=A0A388JYM0_CHABU|nr:hypothetical protein CBR_g34282 [Chara braunii]|eukprot:GBG62910.1 hypothetical protein CBR_g34282 [Chara braunii]